MEVEVHQMSHRPEFAVHEGPSLIVRTEPVRSVLYITPELTVQSSAPLPNRWRRFFYWALLGWKWRRA
jgi:hypothetical protein